MREHDRYTELWPTEQTSLDHKNLSYLSKENLLKQQSVRLHSQINLILILSLADDVPSKEKTGSEVRM
jgi:hypothetical protein